VPDVQRGEPQERARRLRRDQLPRQLARKVEAGIDIDRCICFHVSSLTAEGVIGLSRRGGEAECTNA